MTFSSYRHLIEEQIESHIEQMGEKNDLYEACKYALTNGGKRLRPILVLLIAESLGQKSDVFPAALSVEFFHTASLIADDLPCMDDDDTRRNHPALHRVFDESIAILASYTLIAAGYEGIYKNTLRIKSHPTLGLKSDSIAVLCLESASRCAGMQGATNGQFLDLYPPAQDWETIQKVIYQKTVTLFEIAFVFGWLFGGGEFSELEKVKKSAYHLGMAFQIADDLSDSAQDSSKAIDINAVKSLGYDRAFSIFQEEMKLFSLSLENLGIRTPAFERVMNWLQQMVLQPVNRT